MNLMLGSLPKEVLVPTALKIESDQPNQPSLTITTSGCWTPDDPGVQSLSVTPTELETYLQDNCQDWDKVKVTLKEGLFTRAIFPYREIAEIKDKQVLNGKVTRAGAVVQDVHGQFLTLLFFEDTIPNPVTGETHIHLGCLNGVMLG